MRALAALVALALAGCDFVSTLADDVRSPPGRCSEGRGCPDGEACVTVHPTGHPEMGTRLCLSPARLQRAAANVMPADDDRRSAPPPVYGGTARKWFGVFPASPIPMRGTTEAWCDDPKCKLGPGVRDLSRHTDVRRMGSQELGVSAKFTTGWGCLYACSCGYNEHLPGKCPEGAN